MKGDKGYRVFNYHDYEGFKDAVSELMMSKDTVNYNQLLEILIRKRLGKNIVESIIAESLTLMKKVITYGTYDLLHQGHIINLLRRAKELGDYLIVGVTSDSFDRERGKLNVRNNVLETY